MTNTDIQRLLHRECKAFSGGITSLALTIDKSPNLLSNKLNVDCDQNQLSFVEALDLIALTGSKKTLAAIAAQHGYLLVPVPHCERHGTDLLREVLGLSNEAGKLCGEYSRSIQPSSDLGENLSAVEKRKLLDILTRLQEGVQCLKWELGQ